MSAPASRMDETALATSPVEAGRTMRAGWRVIAPFQMASARARGNPASVGPSTSPGKDRRKRVIEDSSAGMSAPFGL